MAEPLQKPDMGPPLKGSFLPVTIEDVIADVLVVCLEHGAKIYKGILLDSTKRDLPYGVGFDRFRLETEKNEKMSDEITMVDPNKVTDVAVTASEQGKVEVSALTSRYTYQDPNNPTSLSRLLSPHRRNLVRPIRDRKNVRNMRLRPRKVLCSNCHQGIHDNQVKGSTTSTANTAISATSNNATSQVLNNSRNRPPLRMSFPTRTSLRMSLRGKRKTQEEVAITPPVAKRQRQIQQVKHLPQAQIKIPKLPRLPITRVVASRINPVIKISFTSPQGEVHTSKVNTSRSTAELGESELGESHQPNPNEHGTSYEYKRLKRALKKANKIRERTWDESSGGSEVTTTVLDENLVRHHKKSKRNKHKRKHRHRSAIQSPVHDPNKQNENSSDFENDAAKAGLPAAAEVQSEKGKEMEDWDANTGHHVTYQEASPYPTTKETSHFKENSINMPPPTRQQPTPTRPFHSPNDLPSYMDTADTFTPRSPYANRSSCANSQIGSVSPTSTFETDEEGDLPPAGDEFPNNESEQLEEARLRPLMMKIQTKTVSTGFLPDGRHVQVGDVVWGKIHGFPWWPGKILSITVSQRDNGTVITQMAHIAWCGSSTMSHMPCSELYPFLEDFKYRYNKKKKGPYKNAIKEATRIAQNLLSPQTQFESNSPAQPASQQQQEQNVDTNGM